MSDIRPSDEILNAFVDGEFSPEDRLLTLKTIAADQGLSREVCDMYQLKELIAMAYRADALADARGSTCRTGSGRAGWWTAAAAGVAALALGSVVILGVQRDLPDSEALVAANAVVTAESARTLAAVPQDAQQVLLHVTDVDHIDAPALFDDIEYMFETALLEGQTLYVQMVVHGSAMDLVRADLSPYPNRIRDLVQTYPGLRITACGQSLARHAIHEGHPVDLLPWVEEVDSGVHEAARRQAEGWTYIRV
jgi:uncharacterized protein